MRIIKYFVSAIRTVRKIGLLVSAVIGFNITPASATMMDVGGANYGTDAASGQAWLGMVYHRRKRIS